MIKLVKILSEIQLINIPTGKMLSDMNSYLCQKCPTKSQEQEVEGYDDETGENYSYIETYYSPVEYNEEVRDKWESIFEKYKKAFMWDENDFNIIPPNLRKQFYKDQLQFKQKYNL